MNGVCSDADAPPKRKHQGVRGEDEKKTAAAKAAKQQGDLSPYAEKKGIATNYNDSNKAK